MIREEENLSTETDQRVANPAVGPDKKSRAETSNGVRKTVAFHTLGCRLNFSESGSIAQQFTRAGYQVVPFGEAADVTFLNTCTVTDGADRSCRSTIRQAKRANPKGKVVVAGCYAQMESKKLEEMPEADLVLGNTSKYQVLDYLDDSQSDVKSETKLTREFNSSFSTPSDQESGQSRTRAFLKVQDGCDYVCSFCIIPFARGRSRTIDINTAGKQAKELVAAGYREIVLTGVNIGEYERKSGERLEDLVKAVAESGVERLRLSSVEPNTITPSLLMTLKDLGIYQNHFHIPLQSAHPLILKSMRRKYTIEQYQDILSEVKDFFPRASIGADIIVGHPGETEAYFEETIRFVEKSPLTHLHVFPFSERQGTTAAKLSEQVPVSERKRRVRKLVQLGEIKKESFQRSQLGLKTNVLFENYSKNKWWGYSSEFLKLGISKESLPLNYREADLTNRILEVSPEDMTVFK